MDAKELRIGNYVNRELYSPKSPTDTEIIQVASINSLLNIYLCDNECIGCLDELKGIPLTEEILLKCGFKLAEHSSEMYILKLVGEMYLWYDISIDTISIDVYSSCQFLKTKNLHELQNLYFALNNKELEIKL